MSCRFIHLDDQEAAGGASRCFYCTFGFGFLRSGFLLRVLGSNAIHGRIMVATAAKYGMGSFFLLPIA